MRISVVRKLDDIDREFADTLNGLGANRNVATLITYLAHIDEAASKEIEMGTDLSQSEVSIAMRTLRKNGWIVEHSIKIGQKNRSIKVYALNIGLYEVIRHFEEQKMRESARVMESIQRLKALALA